MPSAKTWLLLPASLVLAAASLPAQIAPLPPPNLHRVEPGLEKAVKWVWWVTPSPAADWGLELPKPPPDAASTPPPHPDAAADSTYVVKKGDALYTIAKRHKITVQQLKAFNNLTSDMLHIGDVLKIPTPEELQALGLLNPPPEKKAPEKKAGPAPRTDADNATLQVFLDRELFVPGPIDGKPSAMLENVIQLYGATHPDAANPDALKAKALAALQNDPFTTYVLRSEDFRFIAPPKAQRYDPNATPTPTPKPAKKGKKTAAKPVSTPPPTYDDLTSATMLAYRSPWEFVAERFHCDENFLRTLNPKLPPVPPAGSEFRVPKVEPFEIERAFVEPFQPAAAPGQSIVATVSDLSQLQISRNGQLVAVFPFTPARPGLKGKGAWTILNAIPRPRLATKQEVREKPYQAMPLFGAKPEATPPPVDKTLATEQYIAAGPDSPIGIIWIALAKEDSKDPLPYGLHGTNSPNHMRSFESLGGFRLTNWDIDRAVRLLPAGTPLEWKSTQMAPAIKPGAAVPAAVPIAVPGVVGRQPEPSPEASPASAP